MPRTHQMMDSNYLRKEDIGRGALVTIAGVEQRNIAQDGQAADFKWLMLFHEGLKPLVLNSTNIQLAERICGSDNTDDWMGKQIVLYVDPNVSYAGKLIGGIRIRAPKQRQFTVAGQGDDPLPTAQNQKQSIAQAAAKWSKGHAMPAAVPEPEPEMLEEDEIPF